MLPFRSKFERALRLYARNLPVRHAPADHDERADWSISVDDDDETVSNRTLEGYLCAVIFARAQSDGATRVRFCTGRHCIVYTLGGVDNEMVPPSPEAIASISRKLAQMANPSEGTRGTICVQYADFNLILKVDDQRAQDDPQIETTGFTGERLDCERHVDCSYADQLGSQYIDLMARLT